MEENKVATDSSAPNSPDLTRLSGERAEERTAREGHIWREAFQSALAFASPSPRYGVHRRGDRIFSRMMDLESEANQQCDRELAKRHEAGDSPTKPQACASCSRLASRVEELERLGAFKGYGEPDSLVLGCGHGKWSSKGDRITCLSFAIDSLNKTLAEERIARSTAETKLAGAHAEEKPDD